MRNLHHAIAVSAILAAVAITPVRAADPVTIGLSIPLSPPGDATGGQLIRRGAELAIEYINEKGGLLGGRQARLAVQDSQGRPEAGVAAYRRLVSEEKAVGVTGYFHSSVAIAVNEVAKEIGVPTMSTQASASDITAKGYDIAFRTHAIDPVRVGAWMDFIKKKGFKKVSMIAETTDYGIGLVDETLKANTEKKAGVDFQKVMFDRTVTDLTPQLLQVKAFKPDLVINIGVGQAMDLLIDQAETIGLLPGTAMLVSYDAPARPQYWQLHAKNGNGIYFIAYYSPKSKLSDIGEWLSKTYEAKYKEPPVYPSLNGFGCVMIFAQAVEAAKSTDPKAIIKALEEGKFKSWPDAAVTFPRAKGVYWHNWTPPVLILQFTKLGQDWREADVAGSYVSEGPPQ